MNNNKTWVWIGIVIALLIVVAGVVMYESSTSSAPLTQTVVSPAVPETPAIATNLDIKHQYDAATGTDTYAGTFDMPNPCMSISVTSVVDPTNSNHITLAFTSASTATAGEVCAQVITSRPFKISFPASPNTLVDATIDGHPLVLNVFEVPAGQDLDTYNVNLKG